jgi:hypothetical protein
MKNRFFHPKIGRPRMKHNKTINKSLNQKSGRILSSNIHGMHTPRSQKLTSNN